MSVPELSLKHKNTPLPHSPEDKKHEMGDQVKRTEARVKTVFPAGARETPPEIHPSSSHMVKRKGGKNEKPLSIPLAISKMDSNSSVGVENSPAAKSPILEETSDRCRELDKGFQELNRFLDQKVGGVMMRFAADCHPALSQSAGLSWVKVKKMSSEEQFLHRMALIHILAQIRKGYGEGVYEFFSDPVNPPHYVKTEDLRRKLLDNPRSRLALQGKERQELLNLNRSNYLDAAIPYPEHKILRTLAIDIDTICHIFVDYQIEKINFLREGLDLSGFQTWTPSQRDRHLTQIYTKGLSIEVIEEVLRVYPRGMYAMSQTFPCFALDTFFKEAQKTIPQFLFLFAPLIQEPVLLGYIQSIKKEDKKRAKALNILLEDGDYGAIVDGFVSQDQKKKIEVIKTQLPFALVELGLRAVWLIEQLEGKSERVEKLGKTLLEMQKHLSSYRAIAPVIKNLSRILEEKKMKLFPAIKV